MKIHLPWIRVTATAVLVAGVGVHEAAAQYAPYRPIPQQPAAPAAPRQSAQRPVVAAPATQTPYTLLHRLPHSTGGTDASLRCPATDAGLRVADRRAVHAADRGLSAISAAAIPADAKSAVPGQLRRLSIRRATTDARDDARAEEHVGRSAYADAAMPATAGGMPANGMNMSAAARRLWLQRRQLRRRRLLHHARLRLRSHRRLSELRHQQLLRRRLRRQPMVRRRLCPRDDPHATQRQ